MARSASCKSVAPRPIDAVCPAEDHCADVVDWTAGTCDDVRTNGPYAPGVQVITWTKDSVASPGTPRPLETVVWYPGLPNSSPIDAFTGGILDDTIDGSGAPYPVVLFSHGSCGYAEQSTFLTPLLATRGFIVVAPPHPGNEIFDFPNCGTPAAQAASFLERPKDVIFVLDQLLAANQDPGSPFYGMVDPTRIAMMGHTFGGFTTYLVQQQEPRVKVAIPLAPAALGNPTLTVPSLTVIGARARAALRGAVPRIHAGGQVPLRRLPHGPTAAGHRRAERAVAHACRGPGGVRRAHRVADGARGALEPAAPGGDRGAGRLR